MGTWKYDPWGHCLAHPSGLYARESHGEWRGLRDALRKVDDATFAEAARVAKGDGAAYPVTMRIALAYALADGDWARELVPEWEEAVQAHTIPRYPDGFGWGLLAATSDAATAERIVRGLIKMHRYARVPWHEIVKRRRSLASARRASRPSRCSSTARRASGRHRPLPSRRWLRASRRSTRVGRSRSTSSTRTSGQGILAWVQAHPALRCIAAPLERSPRRTASPPTPRAALNQALHAHPEAKEAAAGLVSERERAVLEQMGTLSAAPEASPAELPPVLVSPPWLGAVRKTKPRPTVAGSRRSRARRARRVVWKAGERDRAKDSGIDWELLVNWTEVPKGVARRSQKIDAHVKKKVDAAKPDFFKRVNFIGTLLSGMSEKAALALWNGLEDIRKIDVSSYDVQKILGDFEAAALPGLLRAAEAWPGTVLPELVRVDSTSLAAPMADALARMKKVGPVARAWLLAFPETAGVALVPLALDGPPKGRDAAQLALRVRSPSAYRQARRSARGGQDLRRKGGRRGPRDPRVRSPR